MPAGCCARVLRGAVRGRKERSCLHRPPFVPPALHRLVLEEDEPASASSAEGGLDPPCAPQVTEWRAAGPGQRSQHGPSRAARPPRPCTTPHPSCQAHPPPRSACPKRGHCASLPRRVSSSRRAAAPMDGAPFFPLHRWALFFPCMDRRLPAPSPPPLHESTPFQRPRLRVCASGSADLRLCGTRGRVAGRQGAPGASRIRISDKPPSRIRCPLLSAPRAARGTTRCAAGA